uniref:Solute-binding protein family 3/N-terminal domain-containing protein n=1 Tax=Odontella aurita TaxID=265563 RepID=A0A7S4MXE2_9STRA|mmetsp:Transcript_38418/g.115127  ORF Transcript_38418/g.115127 Transcript_38418/m.115127 type:complete len:995 (+) Transcript_38418:139-3123(+)
MSNSDGNGDRTPPGKGGSNDVDGDHWPPQQDSDARSSVRADDSNEGQSLVAGGTDIDDVFGGARLDRSVDEEDLAAETDLSSDYGGDRKPSARRVSVGDGNDLTSHEGICGGDSDHIDSNEDNQCKSDGTVINDVDERTPFNQAEGEDGMAAEEYSMYDKKQPSSCPNSCGDTSMSTIPNETCAGEVESSAEGTHESDHFKSRDIRPPENSYAARAARKMDKAKERAIFIKGGQDGAEGPGGANEDPGREDLIPRIEPGDDIAAEYFASGKISPVGDRGRGSVPFGTDDAPRIQCDSDDDTAEPPPIEPPSIAPPAVESEGNMANEESRPGAYEAAGRAPGRVPAWGRRMTHAVRRSITSSVAQGPETREPTYTVPISEAVAVDEVELEDTIRQKILATAARAEVVEPQNHNTCGVACCRDVDTQRKKCAVMALNIFVILGAVLGLSIGLTRGSSDDRAMPNSNSPSTLDDVERRGTVRCDGRSKPSGSDQFFMDLCHAIAAAVFGDPTRVEFVNNTNAVRRFVDLKNRKVDVLSRGITHTCERDVHEPTSRTGFSFSTPYLYSEVSFGGVPFFATCANNLSVAGECSGLKLCVGDGTTWLDLVEGLFPGSNIVKVESPLTYAKNLQDGTCNAIVGERMHISQQSMHDRGYEGSYSMGTKAYGMEPLSLVTRDVDARWSDLVNWVIQVLFVAEEQSITQATAHILPDNFFGGKAFNATRFRNVIAAVGNYGELHERHFQATLSRGRVNELNKGESGLMFSHPFGSLTSNGSGAIKNGTLELIKEHKELRCGIVPKELLPESSDKALYSLDADFCSAVAASATHNARDSVRFVHVDDSFDGFERLAKGEIDVFAGARVHIDHDLLEPKLGVGFSFSQPYFYQSHEGSTSDSKTRALATRQDDPQWSDFVYWVVASTFYAEKERISGELPYEEKKMPLVYLFGEEYRRMFRDAILAVGNYGEIYARNVNTTIPRGGRNNLNNAISLGPQHFPLPFF